MRASIGRQCLPEVSSIVAELADQSIIQQMQARGFSILSELDAVAASCKQQQQALLWYMSSMACRVLNPEASDALL